MDTSKQLGTAASHTRVRKTSETPILTTWSDVRYHLCRPWRRSRALPSPLLAWPSPSSRATSWLRTHSDSFSRPTTCDYLLSCILCIHQHLAGLHAFVPFACIDFKMILSFDRTARRGKVSLWVRCSLTPSSGTVDSPVRLILPNPSHMSVCIICRVTWRAQPRAPFYSLVS